MDLACDTAFQYHLPALTVKSFRQTLGSASGPNRAVGKISVSVVCNCCTYCQHRAEVGCTVPPVTSVEFGKCCRRRDHGLSTGHNTGEELYSFPKCENVEKE